MRPVDQAQERALDAEHRVPAGLTEPHGRSHRGVHPRGQPASVHDRDPRPPLGSSFACAMRSNTSTMSVKDDPRAAIAAR